MKYFHLTSGLRGCYMPDSHSVIAVSTRRELKRIIESECDYLKQSDYVGLSKKAVAAFVADAWRQTVKHKDYVLPYGQGGKYPFGIFLSYATRSEYVEYSRESN